MASSKACLLLFFVQFHSFNFRANEVYPEDCFSEELCADDDESLLLQSVSRISRVSHDALQSNTSRSFETLEVGLESTSTGTQKEIQINAERMSNHETIKLWLALAAASLVIGAAVFVLQFRSEHSNDDATIKSNVTDPHSSWRLIIMSAFVQIIASSVYSMGAWQDELRDALGLSVDGIALIGAATFSGSIAAMLGGLVFDRLGPRASVILGGTMCTIGYLLIGLALIAGEAFSVALKLTVASLGSLMAGYSSVSLLDNVVCMACSVSFPHDRAAVVGYLKAVLATSAGLWALLWVHMFKPPHGLGLPCYIAFTAALSFVGSIVAQTGIRTLDNNPPFSRSDFFNFGILISTTVVLALFDVSVSSMFLMRKLAQSSVLGFIALSLALSPIIVLFLAHLEENQMDRSSQESRTVGKAANISPPQIGGLSFCTAACGLDFWLLWFMQFAVFGSGVATNQNLALILESAGNTSASGLGVALFALSSSLSRIVVGILSDKYNHVVSRFNWMTFVLANALLSQFLVSFMTTGTIMLGALVMGLSFGAFYTVIVPVVNEMYGRRHFGVIMGSQLANQAVAAILICFQLLPSVYRGAAKGRDVCIGSECYKLSFLLLAAMNGVGLVAALILQMRNRDSMPVDRLAEF